MINFGNNKHFSIWVNYDYLELKDDPEFIKSLESRKEYKMWGSVYFWVNNKNGFAYDDPDPKATYTYNLSIIVEFFCEYLRFHIVDDPFPTSTKATNASDMMDEVSLVELPDNDIQKWADVDWDNVDKELYSRIDEWNWRHNIVPHNDGSFLPRMFFRRVNNQIEVSWNDQLPFRSTLGEFYLKHRKGIEYIDLKLYRDTIAEFCFDFLERFHDVFPNHFEELKQNLQEAMKIQL